MANANLLSCAEFVFKASLGSYRSHRERCLAEWPALRVWALALLHTSGQLPALLLCRPALCAAHLRTLQTGAAPSG